MRKKICMIGYWLFKYLTENDILYNKQCGFQKGYSTNHAIVQLSDQLNQAFDHGFVTLGVFKDIRKT